MNITWLPSPNFNLRSSSICMVVIHYTECDCATAMQVLTDPKKDHAVSAHYVIDEQGKVFQLIKDEHRAWHAGVSAWKNYHNINDYSLSIELVNDGVSVFPQLQIKALLVLLETLYRKHNLPEEAVIGHQDVAPHRKIDPGPFFPWESLVSKKWAAWPIGFAPQGVPFSMQSIRRTCAQKLAKMGPVAQQALSLKLAAYGYAIQDYGLSCCLPVWMMRYGRSATHFEKALTQITAHDIQPS